MNTLFQLFSNEVSYAIGWTIIHSLWQCTLIALLIAISYAFTKKSSSATRYWINCAGLLSCLVTSGITFYINYHSTASVEITNTEYLIDITAGTQQTYIQTLSDIINQHINQIAMLWFIGFAVYISKYIAEFFYCQRIKNNQYQAPSPPLQHAFNELKTSLGIPRNIELRISNIIDVPCVIGHFKPVVLLPISIVLGLSTKQIEVILLHELGHVRRNDYLISTLQTLIGVLYFFNPCARWISSKIDEERENACDDIAISISGDPLFYANTLKEFAEMNNNNTLVVAITGHKNLLLNRITRLFVRDVCATKTYGKALTAITLFIVCAGFSVAGYSTEDKSKDDSFTIKLDKEPLSKLLKLTQDFCPNIPKDIKLNHGDQLVSGDFANLKCEHTEAFIKNLDDNLSKTFTGITINEDKISLKQLMQKVEGTCPEIKAKISLSNPEKIVGFQGDYLGCEGLEWAIHELDTSSDAKFIKTSGAKDIKIQTNMEPDTYANAIPLSIPKESIDKVYLGECTALYSVDERGKGFDITAKCTDGKPEAKAFLEKQITTAIQSAQFPIKTENGKAVIVKAREFRLRLDPAKPINDEATASK